MKLPLEARPISPSPAQAPSTLAPRPQAWPPRELLIDFGRKEHARTWSPVGDTVMGGISTSRIERGRSGGLVFRGEMRPRSGQGFASVRGRLPVGCSLADCLCLILRCRGDGKRYSLRLFPDEAQPGLAYVASFESARHRWAQHVFSPFDFRASFRGRPVPEAPDLDLASIHEVGLMIAGDQRGPFRLEVARLEAPRQPMRASLTRAH